MATLIQLTFAPRPASTRATSAATRPSAEIILFPGVRYERAPAAKAAKPKRKRKARAIVSDASGLGR